MKIQVGIKLPSEITGYEVILMRIHPMNGGPATQLGSPGVTEGLP
jgi:hypothetical protein